MPLSRQNTLDRELRRGNRISLSLQALSIFAALFVCTVAGAQNRDLDSWLAQLRSSDEVTRLTAAYSLQDIGSSPSQGIGTLVRNLDKRDPFVRRSIVSLLGDLGESNSESVEALVKALGDEDGAVSKEAALALSKLGTTAIPSLIAALKSRPSSFQPVQEENGSGTSQEIASSAAWALSQMGSRTLPVLIHLLHDGDEQQRRYALAIISKIGEKDPDVLVTLAPHNRELRPYLSELFQRSDKAAIPAISKLLLTRDPEVKRLATLSLANLYLGVAEPNWARRDETYFLKNAKEAVPIALAF